MWLPEGHLEGAFAVSKTGPTHSFLPVLMFGLDYEVFLVPRMREDFIRESDPPSAVVDRYSGSAKVVASAAIIMTAVFAAHPHPDPSTKSLGSPTPYACSSTRSSSV